MAGHRSPRRRQHSVLQIPYATSHLCVDVCITRSYAATVVLAHCIVMELIVHSEYSDLINLCVVLNVVEDALLLHSLSSALLFLL